MCRFILQQPLCPCPAGRECTQLGKGSTIYKKKLFHFRGDALIRSAACSEQLRRGDGVPRRDCPNTSAESRHGWQNDPYGCVRDHRVCASCSSVCPQPDGGTRQGGDGALGCRDADDDG